MKHIFEFIKNNCDATDFAVYVNKGFSHETRFAQNRITQHMAGEDVNISLWVAYGNKTGTASINQDDEESIKNLITNACDVAKFNEPDPEFMPTMPETTLPEVNNYDKEIEKLTPEQIVNYVNKCCQFAISKNAKIAGMTEKHINKGWVYTKNGFNYTDTFTSFGHSMTIKLGEVETKVETTVKRMKDFCLEDQITKLDAQLQALDTPKPFDACKIPVILMPEAVKGLLGFLGWTMQKRQADEGLTPFTNQLGKEFFGKKFSMYSTLEKEHLFAQKADFNGIANKNTTWIENGILKNMPCGRYWAQQTNYEPKSIFNVYVPGEDNTIEDLMKMVDKGILINSFWYIRFVDQKTGELTGMTRDGVIYFENGKPKHAVNNFRWNEIPHEATKRIIALGKNTISNNHMDLPPMLIDDFNFVDTTRF